MADIEIGLNVTNVRTQAEGPEFKVGTVAGTTDPATGAFREYVYVNSVAGVTDAGYVCALGVASDATMLTTTNAAAGTFDGARLGVGVAAIAANGYGWVQIYGPCVVRCAAAAAIYTRLHTTATAGALDDAVTTSRVNGLVITTAAGGAATVAGFANYPNVSLVA